MHDTLLPLTQAEDNAACLSSLGGDVRLYTYQFSHASPSGLGMSSPPPVTFCNGFDCFALFQYYFEQYSDVSGQDYSQYQFGCGPYSIPELEVTWLRAKLQQNPAAIAELAAAPRKCLSLGASPDGISLDGVAAPTPVTAAVPATNVIAGGTNQAPIAVPLVTLDEASVLQGRPRATLTVTPTVADPLGLEDPILFLALARSRASYNHYCHEYADPWPFAPQAFCMPVEITVGDLTTPAYFEVIDDQITPIRGYGTHQVDLSSLGERLGAGEQIQLFVFGYHYAYVASGSGVPLAVTVQGSIDVPLHASEDLPSL